MQLIENRVLALGLALALVVAALPVGLAQHATGGLAKAAPAEAGRNLVFLPLISQSDAFAQPTPPAVTAGWLDYVNYYRALAALPPVKEDMALSVGAQQLAACIVASDKYHEYEWQFNPNCQPFSSFRKIAQASNLYVTSTPDATDVQALTTWIEAPFHALGILDPALQRVGFGSDRDANGAVRMAAVLNVTGGRVSSRAGLVALWPVLWPADHATVVVSSYAADTDSPEPLASCPGYPAVTGLPIILQVGDGSLSRVDVTASSLKSGGASLDHCVFTQSTYTNLDANDQAAGRALLAARNAVVLLPKQPLTPGAIYLVSVTANGRTTQWSFQVAGN